MSDPVVIEQEQEAPSGTPQLSAEDMAMVEKGRAGLSEAPVAAPAGTPERPAHIPEKFWKDGKVDTEGMAQSYAALEQRLGKGTEEAPTGAAPAAEVGADGKITKPAAEEAAEAAANPLAGLLDAARDDYSSSKGFSEETATKLTEAGIPPEVQAVYLAGLEALATQNVAAIHGFVGGEKAYTDMAAWAAEKLNDAELDAFNNSLDNPDLRENAVRGLYARYAAARPSEGRFVAPAGAAVSDGDAFKSRDELTAAMKDPRYATDARYRGEVEAKLARSHAAGFRVSPPRMFDSVYRHNA
jgi:hypothetical protein